MLTDETRRERDLREGVPEALEVAALEREIIRRSHALCRQLSRLEGEALAARYRGLKRIKEQIDGLYLDLYESVALATHSAYTGEDVRRWCQRSIDRGCGHPQLDAGVIRDLIYYRRVPNELLRREYVLRLETTVGRNEHLGSRAMDTTTSELIAQVQGHLPRRLSAKTLNRALGIEREQRNDGKGARLAWLMSYEVAAAVTLSLGLLPAAVGV